MASSGTATFESGFLIDDVIQEAYDRVGLRSVSGYQLKSARRSLNIMFQEWANRGLHYWEIGNANLDLVEGQASYILYRSTADGTSATTIPASLYGVDDILEATFRTSRGTTNQNDSALTKINRSTYSGLSNKLSKGQPTQYYVQRFIDNITINIYPTPDATAAAKEVSFYYVKRIQDAGDYTNDADVPYRFVPCMIAGLSYYLAIKYAPDKYVLLKQIYNEAFEYASTNDNDGVSLKLQPTGLNLR